MAEETEDIEVRYWDGLRRGEAASLEWLYVRYFKSLYNYGKKLSVDDKSLEDGIQDLFVDLWKFRKNLSATSSVKFYLYRSLRRRIVRNASHVKHSQKLLTALPGYLESYVPCEEETMIDNEINHDRVNRLKKMLADLSPRQYEAMVLRFYDELSFQEIAAILNVNEQSARNLVQRGLSHLKHFSRLLMAIWTMVG